MRTRVAMAFAVAATVAHLSGHQAVPINANPAWRIGERFDAQHVVIYVETGRWAPRDVETWGPKLKSPIVDSYRYVFDVTNTVAQNVVKGRAHVGDRWILDAGEHGWFHARVERLVMGDVECAEGWGVLVAVVPDEAAAFAALHESYYPAQPDSGGTPSARTSTVRRLPINLSASQQTELRSLLEQARTRTTSDVVKFVSDFGESATRNRWLELSAALGRGDAALDFDIEAFRMTPDADPRAYVRASWKIGNQTAYLLAAWIRVGPHLSIEHADTSASRLLLLQSKDELERTDFGRRLIARIVNISDVDRDGWGEILMYTPGYDGGSTDLYRYAPSGDLKIISSLSGAC